MQYILKKHVADIGMSLLGIVILCLVPSQIGHDSTQGVNSSTLPLVLGGIITVLPLLKIAKDFIQHKQDSEETKTVLVREKHGKGFIIVALLLAWTILLPIVGFIITTILFLVFFMYAIGNRSWVQIILISIITTISIYLLFENLFYIFLPQGSLFM